MFTLLWIKQEHTISCLKQVESTLDLPEWEVFPSAKQKYPEENWRAASLGDQVRMEAFT